MTHVRQDGKSCFDLVLSILARNFRAHGESPMSKPTKKSSVGKPREYWIALDRALVVPPLGGFLPEFPPTNDYILKTFRVRSLASSTRAPAAKGVLADPHARMEVAAGKLV